MSDLVERLRESWSSMGPVAAKKINRILLERKEAASRISQQDAELERMRREVEEARNDEWLAAITAVQYMVANWQQDCRSQASRDALNDAAEDIISALKNAGPTEYLDMKWKGAEAAVAAEERAEAAEAKAAEARKAAFIEAAEIIKARMPLYTELQALNACRECISSIDAAREARGEK